MDSELVSTKKVIVSGSIAYDHIMDFPGYFKDHILPDKIHILSVSFLVDRLEKMRGGCAPNIAYSLALLGMRPYVFGAAGKDFAEYCRWMEDNNIDTSLVRVYEDIFTASAFITNDLSDNQITGFYPGAMEHAKDMSLTDIDFKNAIDLVVIAPNNPHAMVRAVEECKLLDVPYLYDPGMQMPRLTAEDLLNGIKGAKLLIVNDYELEMLGAKTGLTKADMLKMSEIVITTYGEEGCTVERGEEFVNVPSCKAFDVVDPTGAGDAFRAGVVKAVLEDKSLADMGRLGNLTAVYAVEQYGTTNHAYDLDDFNKRFIENYGDAV